MSIVALQRCLHHQDREAVARCPECQRFFCRECITEHDDRVICASCLARISRPAKQERRPLRIGLVLRPMSVLAGVLVCWWCFYFIGRLLLSVPSDFHAEKLWDTSWLEDDPAMDGNP